MTRPWTIVLTVAGVAAAAAYGAGAATDHYLMRMIAKPWPVLLMAVAVFAGTRHAYGRLVAAGLVACLAGDVLLEASPRSFLAGVGAFLVGHLLYTAAYLGRSRAWRPAIAVPFAAWGVAVFVAVRPGLLERNLEIPVAVYIVTICAMMWRAGACWEEGGVSKVTLLAFAGAVAFGLSDSLIAFDRFQAPIPGGRYAIMSLYWLGQLGITLSAVRASARRSAVPGG